MTFEHTWARFALGLAATFGLTAAAQAQCGTADTYEDNDDCLSAVVLTPGTYTGLTCQGPADPGGDDRDFYRVTVPAGEQIAVDVLHTWSATEDIDSYIYDASNPTCGDKTTFLDDGYTSSDNENMTWSNTTGASVDVIVEVSAWLGGTTQVICDDYDLVITVGPDPCLSTPDDSFEDNDACGAGAVLAAGLHTGLYLHVNDIDHYEITIPTGQVLNVTQTYSAAVELFVDLYDDNACTSYQTGAGWGGGNNTFTFANTTGAPQTVYMWCDIDDFTGDCNTYDLDISFTPDPCQQTGNDDALEENDDCASATTIGSQTYTGLFVSKADPDVYTFQLAPGGTADFSCNHNALNGDIDLFLYDDTPGACLDGVSYLVSAETGLDNEILTYTNTTGATVTYFLHVEVWASSDVDCNNYDLVSTLVGNQIATPMCQGDGTFDAGSGPASCPCANESAVGANEGCQSSLGFGAVIEATGSNSVANDDIVFHLSQARANQPSLLVQGSVLIAVPFKDGILCTGNPTERIEVVFLDSNGEGSTTASIITEGNVGVGDTRYYQFWFRDPGGVSPCGSGSNFSSGLRVTYN